MVHGPGLSGCLWLPTAQLAHPVALPVGGGVVFGAVVSAGEGGESIPFGVPSGASFGVGVAEGLSVGSVVAVATLVVAGKGAAA
jgi:hypothetical protein